MAAGDPPSEEGGIDWRRLAADRNVSHDVARALWEHAHVTAPGDPVQAEHAFQVMLEEAEAASATHEPGRETLLGGTPGARDASSLGPGKWTRVLLEKPKSAGAARRATQRAAQPSGKAGTEPGKLSAESLRDKLVAAGQAAKDAADLLATSDPATILEALLELRAREPGVLQKIMSVAGGAIERILGHQPQSPADPAAAPASEASTATTTTPDPAAADPAAAASPAPTSPAPASPAPTSPAPASPAPASPAPASPAPTSPAPASAASTNAAAANSAAANTTPASQAPANAATTNTAPENAAAAPTTSASTITAPTTSASTATAPATSASTGTVPTAANRTPATSAPAPGAEKPTGPSRSSRS